ncbi:MAG: hypothetical protein JNN12_04685 [Bacteroidetes Order II. Incertae sedis bacterium]|nr:hypothetical protein [Bacteroidetes Order II. bacterium]
MKTQKMTLAEFAAQNEVQVLSNDELAEAQGGAWIAAVGWAIGAISAGVAGYFASQNTGISAAQSVCNNALMSGQAASASSKNFSCQVK